jgi:hypothetical protein
VEHPDIISVLSGKSVGSFNRFARKKKRVPNTTIKNFEKKDPLSPKGSQGGSKYGGFSTFLGKAPQNFQLYSQEFYDDAANDSIAYRGFERHVAEPIGADPWDYVDKQYELD